jgi:hypothetical protein
MKTYVYQGPDSGITLQDKETSTDVLLRAGKTVRLPEGNAAVKTLAAQGYLVEQVDDAAPAPAVTEKPTPKSTKAAKE